MGTSFRDREVARRASPDHSQSKEAPSPFSGIAGHNAKAGYAMAGGERRCVSFPALALPFLLCTMTWRAEQVATGAWSTSAIHHARLSAYRERRLPDLPTTGTVQHRTDALRARNLRSTARMIATMHDRWPKRSTTLLPLATGAASFVARPGRRTGRALVAKANLQAFTAPSSRGWFASLRGMSGAMRQVILRKRSLCGPVPARLSPWRIIRRAICAA